ncbi:MAG: radical SAM protein [Polyangiaceae bacterium]|nr:radical SAM protein [Polyangiaceae bacterium]
MSDSKRQLTVHDHDRSVVGMTYVYPVVSRRAGGVSVGINLNPNDACNWRCVYCQVPNLKFGKGPPIDLNRLRDELERMLDSILQGSFLQEHVAEGARLLKDIAFSGNGEPTSSPDFAEAVEAVGRVIDDRAALEVPVVLITNGSLLRKVSVQSGIDALAKLDGRVWFKFDSATAKGMSRINGTQVEPQAHLENLAAVAQRCPTWIQTCLFSWSGAPPSEDERSAYLEAMDRLVGAAVPIRGVLLYTIARPSHQPEAAELGSLSREWLDDFAERIRERGLPVDVSE